jgi:hypothetical protein
MKGGREWENEGKGSGGRGKKVEGWNFFFYVEEYWRGEGGRERKVQAGGRY